MRVPGARGSSGAADGSAVADDQAGCGADQALARQHVETGVLAEQVRIALSRSSSQNVLLEKLQVSKAYRC